MFIIVNIIYYYNYSNQEMNSGGDERGSGRSLANDFFILNIANAPLRPRFRFVFYHFEQIILNIQLKKKNRCK